MLKQRLIVGLLLIALTAAGVAAEPPKQVNIAVIDFAAENMPQIEALTVTSFFRTGLVNANMFNVLERNSMDSILTEQGFQMSGCTSNDCAVKIGKLLNAEKIVIGSVSKLDNYYYITASVVDVESGKIICSDRVMTSKKKQLPDKAEDLALTLSEILAGKKPADRRKLDFEKMGILIYDIGPFATVPSATQIVNGPASDYYRFNIKTQDASSIVSMTPSVGFRYFIFDDLYADFGFGFPKTAQNENLNIGFSGSFNVVNNLNYSVQQDMTYLLSVNHLFCPYKKVRFPVGIGVLSTSFKMSYTEGNYAYTSVNSDAPLANSHQRGVEGICCFGYFPSTVLTWPIFP